MGHQNEAKRVSDPNVLRTIIGQPFPGALKKEMVCLDGLSLRFLSMSTILFISTVGSDGRADVSPRGDIPGFIKILDERTIAIPDRPGNGRIDTMSNILGNPDGSVGLIFLVPGFDEVLRASGHATVSSDPTLLNGMAVNGKVPKLAVVIALDQVFFHCGKALKRSRLWDPAARVDRQRFPSYAEILHICQPDKPLEKIEMFVTANYKNELF